MKARPSGFDQKQMLPENYAMMQMALMKTPPPGPGANPGGMPPGGMGMAFPPMHNTVTNPEVELFLQHNPVEPHAATRLRSLPVELQKIVLSRGSLFGGRDPTAVLLGRVRAATRGQSGAMGMGGMGGVPWSGTTAAAPAPMPAQPPAQSGGPRNDESWQKTSAHDFIPQDMKQGERRSGWDSKLSSAEGDAGRGGGAPALNPFRSKARDAPVATEPDPAPMENVPEFNLQHTPKPMDEQSLPPLSSQQEPPPQQESRFSQMAPPVQQQPPPEPAAPKERLWAPSAQDLADLGVPPGIAVRMIRQNKILADEDNMPIIHEELAGQEEDVSGGIVTGGGGGSAGSADAEGAKDPQIEIKKAQAVTTLSYYGLTDPNNQEDVAKAVQAVAAATGDQATAVALWHQMLGTTNETGNVAELTEEQQAEVQQAAQQAQYSQYWLQQQFQSQLAMFENQRLMATGDNPVENVEDARASALKGPRGDPAVAGRRKPSTNQPMLPGDWTCPGCGDHQFARNRVCRFCGASRPIGSH